MLTKYSIRMDTVPENNAIETLKTETVSQSHTVQTLLVEPMINLVSLNFSI